MGNLRLGIIVVLLISTSGCAFVGGFFKGDECEGGNCESPELLDNPNTSHEWFCYGKLDTDEWDCSAEEDPSKIVSISPNTRRARTESINQISTAPSRPVQNEQAIDPASDEIMSARSATALEITDKVEQEPIELARSDQQVLPDSREVADQSRSESTLEGSQQAQAARQFDSLSTIEQLLQQPRDAFAVQLLALQEEGAILAYARSKGLNSPLYARINNQGSEWYVLLLGVYPDRSAANFAKDEWERSKSLTTRPWIRQLGPLQDAVRAASDG